MATITICSPVALGPTDVKPLAPAVASLAGRVLGIRVDRAWQSFTASPTRSRGSPATELGVARRRDLRPRDPHRHARGREREGRRLRAHVDAAIVGLGT